MNRRNFFYSLNGGLGALAMTDLLAKEDSVPLGPKEPMHQPKAKNVIMLFMEGGPSHMDTFDPKQKLNALHKTESKSTRGLERGFKFFGPTICYSYLQAMGFINDHLQHCFRWSECQTSS